MKPTPEPTATDPCPACGDSFIKAPVPTEEQLVDAFSGSGMTSLPARADTAKPAVRDELGVLYRCRGCGYQTRVKSAA